MLRENRQLRHQCTRLGAVRELLSNRLTGAMGEMGRMHRALTAPDPGSNPEDVKPKKGPFGLSWSVLIAGMVGMIWGMILLMFLAVQYGERDAASSRFISCLFLFITVCYCLS